MYCPSCSKSMAEGAAFCSGCGKPAGAVPAKPKKSNPLEILWKIFATVVIVLGGLFILSYIFSRPSEIPGTVRSSSSNPLRALVRQPVAQKLYSGQMVVGPGQTQFWTLNISPQMVEARLVGSFHAMGGTGNDIQVVVANPSEFENWKNGHQAKVYYSTQRTTNGQFNVQLAPGTYVLAFSNGFSALTAKEVAAEVELDYQR